MKRNQKNQPHYVIGLDCSTTATKAFAFDRKGGIAASAHVPIPLFSPAQNLYEQNPDDWWRSVRTVLKEITHRIDPETLLALSISHQRETFVPFDRDGVCLRPAILWLDERCKDEVEAFSKKIGPKKLHAITGKPIDYAPVVYRLAWMKRCEPALFKKIGKICDVQSYIVQKLSGVWKTSWASADPFGLFDLKKKEWSSPILFSLGLHPDQFPETVRPGILLGQISAHAAKLTGLKPGTSIIAGGGDGQAAGLGSNVLSSNRAYLNLGTAVVAGVYGKKYRTSSAFRTLNSFSEEGYYYESSLRAGTFSIDWFIRNILKMDPLADPGIYHRLEAEAQLIPPGSGGLRHVPYLCGVMNPYWDTHARGIFTGLAASHTRAHLYRSILEGIALEQALAIQAIEKEIGNTVQEFVTIGGGAASELWCRIVADCTGKAICIPKTTEASALGAAIAAAVGCGWYGSFQEAADAMTGIKQRMSPARQNYHLYQKIFILYKKIYPAFKKSTQNN